MLTKLLHRLGILHLRTSAQHDAEIRAELQFHLDMQTEENLATGLNFAEARAAAERQLGDFDAIFHACRDSNRPWLAIWRPLQPTLLVVLAGLVVWQAVKLAAIHQQHEQQFAQLTTKIDQLTALTTGATEADVIPTVNWQLERFVAPTAARDPQRIDDLVQAMQHPQRPIDEPWADWKPLGRDFSNL